MLPTRIRLRGFAGAPDGRRDACPTKRSESLCPPPRRNCRSRRCWMSARGCAEAPNGRRACRPKNRQHHSAQSRAAGRRDACPTRLRPKGLSPWQSPGKWESRPTNRMCSVRFKTSWLAMPRSKFLAPRKSRRRAARRSFRGGWVGGGGGTIKRGSRLRSKASLPVHHTNVEEPAGAPLAHPGVLLEASERSRSMDSRNTTVAAVPDRGGGLPRKSWNSPRLCVVCSDAGQRRRSGRDPRNQESEQTLWRPHRSRRHQLLGPARVGLRPAGTERRRQDHDHPHDHADHRLGLGDGAARRCRSTTTAAASSATCRRSAGSTRR